jgi:hypothetical protein
MEHSLKAIKAAKRLCRRCPVKQECLDMALEFGSPGIWGNKTTQERELYEMLSRVITPPTDVSSNVHTNTERLIFSYP